MTPAPPDSRKFAITIPCFKSEHTIAATLEGVMAQGDALQRVACVVLADDVTPDKTLEVARSVWKLNDPPLKIERRRKNVGEMINVNTTVASLPPQVEWFLHMHGDNIPKAGWLQMITDRCMQAAPSVGIVCASYDNLFDDGHVTPGDEMPDRPVELIKGDAASVRGTIHKGCWWHNSCGAIRVSAFREVGGLPPGMRQKGDWDFLLRLLHAGWDIEYIPRTLMLYRLHDNSASGFAFRIHLDIEESLQVVQKYSKLLSWVDIIRYHGSSGLTLARRIAGSAKRGDWLRARKALRMQIRNWASCISCLAAR